MHHYYFLHIFLIVLLICSLTSGRALYFDDLDSEERQNSQSENSNGFYKEKDFLRRSILDTSQSRQDLIDILRKAYNQGWKPNIKHYIPATRFGRHRR